MRPFDVFVLGPCTLLMVAAWYVHRWARGLEH
ncbi:MAG: hypothetical protein JWP11_1298 [Frankiales bacterium]|nr:hypothetical protein [Frankiales bacterium]